MRKIEYTMARYGKEQKESWLREWETSGLSIADYSKDKPFDPSTFHYWLKKTKAVSVQSNFVNISSPPIASTPQVRIDYPHGVRVDLYYQPCELLLKQLVGC